MVEMISLISTECLKHHVVNLNSSEFVTRKGGQLSIHSDNAFVADQLKTVFLCLLVIFSDEWEQSLYPVISL